MVLAPATEDSMCKSRVCFLLFKRPRLPFLLFAADNLFTPCLDWCEIELFLGGLFPVRAVEK
jgi:hypothetical protein